MDVDTCKLRDPRRALVLIPGALNYFYNLNGRRLAESLRELGFHVDVATLPDCPEQDYSWCILVNITEVILSAGSEVLGLKQVRQLRRRCRAMASCSIDCVSTEWYQRLGEWCQRTEVESIVDLGMCDQSAAVPRGGPAYHFVPSGLTSTEQKQLRDIQAQDDERPIPWTFVGHHTPERVALVDHLLRFVDTRGFVYLPGLAPYTETGSPHLNQEQLETVLRKTRYQVWCSHHNFFYMEPERFRLSLLTGSVPVKVVASKAGVPEDVPFPYLVMRWQEVPERLRGEVFTEVRRRFQDDFTRLPTLTAGLARFLVKAGVLPADNLNHVLDPARQPRGLAA